MGPCLMVPAASIFNLGPWRCVSAAKYIIHHFSRGRLEEGAMQQAAEKLRHKQDVVHIGLFRSDVCFCEQRMRFYEDQWRLGYMTVFEFLRHGFGVFVLGRHIPPVRYPCFRQADKRASWAALSLRLLLCGCFTAAAAKVATEKFDLAALARR